MSQKLQHHILAGLDLSSMDESILAFLTTHGKMLTDEKFHFIHVDEKSSDHSKRAEKLAKIKHQIPSSLAKSEIHLKIGSPEDELKKLIDEQDIDLVVLGLKTSPEYKVEAKRLVKKPFCSLLLVPKKESYSINKICVAIDFSSASLAILEEADSIAQKTGAKLIGFHSYQVPSGYHKSGKDHREFAQVMEKNTKNEAETFLKRADINKIEMHYHYDENKEPAECIAQFARDQQIDLMVMGSKGRTGAASMLIGSVAKKLTQILRDVPLMILKKKNESMDVIDALKEV